MNALYVYGFVPPDSIAAASSSAPPHHSDATVFLFHIGDIGVLASEVMAEDFTGPAGDKNLQDLAWLAPRACHHQSVLNWAMQLGAVCPVRFGTLLSSRDALADFLHDHGECVRAFLQRIVDREEWLVQGRLDRDRAAHATLEQLAQREPAPSTPGAIYLHRKRLQQRTQAELEGWLTGQLDAIRGELLAMGTDCEHLTIRDTGESVSTSQTVLRCAHLVRRDHLTNFRARLEEMNARTQASGLTIDLSGPWPPSSFCPSFQK